MGVVSNKIMGVVGKAVTALKPGEKVMSNWNAHSILSDFVGKSGGFTNMERGSILAHGAATSIRDYAKQGTTSDKMIRGATAIAGYGVASMVPRALSGSASPLTNAKGERDIAGIPFI